MGDALFQRFEVGESLAGAWPDLLVLVVVSLCCRWLFLLYSRLWLGVMWERESGSKKMRMGGVVLSPFYLAMEECMWWWQW